MVINVSSFLLAAIDNFKTVLNGRKAALVEFYAPWYVKTTGSLCM
jgi:hypothetical protein